MTYPVPGESMLKVRVPPAPTVALTTAPLPAPPAGPTLTMIISPATSVIDKLAPDAGSEDLGYSCSVKKSSSEHLKTIDSSAMSIVSLVVNPWFGIVNLNSPLWDMKTASVAVKGPPELAVIEFSTALTNLCSNARSVTPIETGSLYPEPVLREKCS